MSGRIPRPHPRLGPRQYASLQVKESSRRVRQKTADAHSSDDRTTPDGATVFTDFRPEVSGVEDVSGIFDETPSFPGTDRQGLEAHQRFTRLRPSYPLEVDRLDREGAKRNADGLEPSRRSAGRVDGAQPVPAGRDRFRPALDRARARMAKMYGARVHDASCGQHLLEETTPHDAYDQYIPAAVLGSVRRRKRRSDGKRMSDNFRQRRGTTQSGRGDMDQKRQCDG